MNSKILVTGFTGRLGSLVAGSLRDEHGLNPRVLVRSAHLDDSWIPPPGMEVVSGDYIDPASLAAALTGIEAVFLVSPVNPEMRNRELALVRQAARLRKPPQIVKISGLGTRPDSSVDSGRWHAEIERDIRATGLTATCLRPLFFMQNLAFQVEAMREDGVLRGAIGDAAIAMIDARDIAEVAAVALLGESPIEGRSVELTGARALTYDAVAEVFSQAFGRPVRYVRQSTEDVARVLEQTGQPDWHIRLLLQFNEAFLRGEGAQTSDVVSRVLGRPPRTLEAYAGELATGATVRGSDPFPS